MTALALSKHKGRTIPARGGDTVNGHLGFNESEGRVAKDIGTSTLVGVLTIGGTFNICHRVFPLVHTAAVFCLHIGYVSEVAVMSKRKSNEH